MFKDEKGLEEITAYLKRLEDEIREFEQMLAIRISMFCGKNQKDGDLRIKISENEPDVPVGIHKLCVFYHTFNCTLPEIRKISLGRQLHGLEYEEAVKDVLKKLILVARDLELEISREQIPQEIKTWLYCGSLD